MLKEWNIEEDPELLGTGAFGAVVKASNSKDPKFKTANKIIRKKDMHPECLRNFKREISMLQKVDHPNIVKMFEFYEDDD